MLVAIGASVIVGGVCFAGFLLFRKYNGLAVIGFCFASTIAGVAIANLPRIIKAGYSGSRGATLGLDFEQAAREVRNDAADVKAIKFEIERLAKEVQATESRITQSEHHVEQMQETIRAANKALFSLILISIDVRGMFAPPACIIQELNRQLSVLGLFAFMTPQERSAEVMRINELIQRAFHPATPAPTPMVAPTR